MIRKFLAALALCTFFAAAASAAPDKYTFDKDHTHVLFFVNHLGFSNMWGRVKEFDGHFTFDEKEPLKSEVEVTLKTASIDTDVPALNAELQKEKFFNGAKFPTIHFKSTSILLDKKDPKTGYVLGNLTLLGVTKPVTLTVTYNKSGVHPYSNNYISGFSADASFKRSDFGMKSYIPDVGDEVNVHIEAEGIDALKHPGNVKTPH